MKNKKEQSNDNKIADFNKNKISIKVGDYVKITSIFSYKYKKKIFNKKLTYFGCIIKISGSLKNKTFKIYNKNEQITIIFFVFNPNIKITILRDSKYYFKSLRSNLNFLTKDKILSKKKKLLNFKYKNLN